MEKVTILVVPRDRFSLTFKCIKNILDNTPQPYDLKVILGGAPEKIKKRLQTEYGKKVEFIFTNYFLNPAQSRNIGLKKTATRLAAIVDNDVMVNSGWLEALVQCQIETNAGMVIPVVLEYEHKIHTAGNSYYVTHEQGKAYAIKELCFYGCVYSEGSNLKRQRTDYGELHCQLVKAREALELSVFDENIQEVGECDSGKIWERAGHPMYFEPKSVVSYELPKRIVDSADIKFFAWRWDMRIILKGYQYYQEKWDEDITECGIFQDFLLKINRTLGLLPRIFPCQFSLWIDHLWSDFVAGIARFLSLPNAAFNRCYSKFLGYYEWPKFKYTREG